MKVNRRKLGGGLVLAAGIALFVMPFLFHAPTQSAATMPPPPSGNDHGNKSGGGSSPPPCTIDCQSSADTLPPTTIIQMTGALEWPRNNITYFYPNITIILSATDDQNLASITLNDNGTITNFKAEGRSATTMLTLTNLGVHTLSYFATDGSGNKENPHKVTVGLNKPELSDIKNLIANSNIDNSGVKNALIAKLTTAQTQIDAGQKPNALNALCNQLSALDGKHGLDHTTVDLIEAMIATASH